MSAARRYTLTSLVSLCALSVGLGLVAMPAGAVSLPDGRVYEMVTPLENQDANVYVPNGLGQGEYSDGVLTRLPFEAAAGGDAVAYAGDPTSGGNGREGGGAGNEYLASRSAAGGWTQVNLQPSGDDRAVYQAFSSELSIGVLDSSESPALAAAAPGGRYDVLYTHAASGAGYSPLFTVTPPSGRPFYEFGSAGVPNHDFDNYTLAFAGASADFSQLLFEANDALTPNAVDGGVRENNLYDSSGGEVSLVNVLPDGAAAPNATFGAPLLEYPESMEEAEGNDSPDWSDVISEDGSRVFWTDVSTGDLYVRENATQPQSPLGASGECLVSADACTVQLDVSQGPGSNGGGRFWTASKNGSKVFFTDCGRLTVDSTAVTSAGCTADVGHTGERGADLYEYEFNSVVGRPGTLTDLTVDGNASDALGADVQGVIGADEDGEYVYLVANGVLTEGKNAEGKEPVAGQLNIYLRHDGRTTYIATLSPADTHYSGGGVGGIGDYEQGLGNRTAEVTQDGRALVFTSKVSLTGYQNEKTSEVYVYEAEGERLLCVSCKRGGEPASAGERAYLYNSYSNTYLPRWISDDGSRVFFNSTAALVPQDTNGVQDVYEWERDGAGSCRESAGCVYLLSGGTNASESWFLDASASGDDAFVITRAQLTPEDQNDNFNVFDARVGGVQALSPPVCSGSGCQGVPAAPPIFATPSSATFSGVGNFPAASTAPANSTQKPKHAKKKVRKRVKAKHRRSKRRAKRASVNGRAHGKERRS
jgi:hypothetical protein